MPVYQCYSPKGLLTKAAKAKIADEMTSMYCTSPGDCRHGSKFCSTRCPTASASRPANRQRNP
jgi:hypothetical protein